MDFRLMPFMRAVLLALPFAVVFYLLPYWGKAQSLSWVQVGGPTGSHSRAFSIATDPAGNVYTIGQFYQTLQLGSFTLVSEGYSDIFISKHTASGVCLWAVSGGSFRDDTGFSIKLLPNGDAIFCGSMYKTATFGNISISGSGLYSVPFVGKISANGQFLWVTAGTAAEGFMTNSNLGADIAIDSNQDIYLAGHYVDTLTFGNLIIAPYSLPGYEQIGFLAKFSANGNPVWLKRMEQRSYFSNIILAQNGNLYTAGGGQFPNRFKISSFTTQGDPVWSEQITTTTNSQRIGSGHIIEDSEGNLVASGYFSGTITLASHTISSSVAAYDAGLIAKFSPSGTPIWLKRICGGTGRNYAWSLAALPAGEFLLSGEFSNNPQFGSTAFSSYGGLDAFFGRYNSDGLVQQVVRLGGPEDDHGYSVAPAPDGEIYIGGDYMGTATIGNQTLPQQGSGTNMFLARTGLVLGVPALSASQYQGLSVYPNPAATEVTLALPQLATGARLQLLNPLGQVVWQQKVSAGQTEVRFSVAGLATGCYVVKLLSDGEVRTHRLVVN